MSLLPVTLDLFEHSSYKLSSPHLCQMYLPNSFLLLTLVGGLG